MIRKMISLFLLALMALPMGALAEDGISPLVGRIVEVLEDGSYLLQELSGTGDQIKVILSENATEESEWAIGLDDVVLVRYTGTISSDNPPEADAETISSHSLEGPVTQVNEEANRVLINSTQMGEVWATLPETEQAASYENKYVRIYYNGIMALSYPGQVTALSIQEVFTETGDIIEVSDNHFLMKWGDSELIVNFDSHTKVIESFDVGDTVIVYYSGIMTRSMPGQIYAQVIAREKQEA